MYLILECFSLQGESSFCEVRIDILYCPVGGIRWVARYGKDQFRQERKVDGGTGSESDNLN